MALETYLEKWEEFRNSTELYKAYKDPQRRDEDPKVAEDVEKVKHYLAQKVGMNSFQETEPSKLIQMLQGYRAIKGREALEYVNSNLESILKKSGDEKLLASIFALKPCKTDDEKHNKACKAHEELRKAAGIVQAYKRAEEDPRTNPKIMKTLIHAMRGGLDNAIKETYVKDDNESEEVTKIVQHIILFLSINNPEDMIGI